MSMCTYGYVYMYMCASVHMCACVNRSMSLSGCMCGGICVSVCVYVNGHICVYSIWILPMTIGGGSHMVQERETAEGGMNSASPWS